MGKKNTNTYGCCYTRRKQLVLVFGDDPELLDRILAVGSRFVMVGRNLILPVVVALLVAELLHDFDRIGVPLVQGQGADLQRVSAVGGRVQQASVPWKCACRGTGAHRSIPGRSRYLNRVLDAVFN